MLRSENMVSEPHLLLYIDTSMMLHLYAFDNKLSGVRYQVIVKLMLER